MHRKNIFTKTYGAVVFFWFQCKSEVNHWILGGYEGSDFDNFKQNFSFQTALKTFLGIVWHRDKEQTCYLRPYKVPRKRIKVKGCITENTFTKV